MQCIDTTPTNPAVRGGGQKCTEYQNASSVWWPAFRSPGRRQHSGHLLRNTAVPSLIFIKGAGRITGSHGPFTGYLRYCPHAIRKCASCIRPVRNCH